MVSLQVKLCDPHLSTLEVRCYTNLRLPLPLPLPQCTLTKTTVYIEARLASVELTSIQSSKSGSLCDVDGRSPLLTNTAPRDQLLGEVT